MENPRLSLTFLCFVVESERLPPTNRNLRLLDKKVDEMATVTRLRKFLSRVLVYLTLASSPPAHSHARHSLSPGLLVRLERSGSQNLSPRCLEISTVFPYVRMGRMPTQAVAPVVEIATLTTTVNSRTSTGLTYHSLPTGSYGGPATLSRSPNQPFVEWNALQCDGCNTCSSCFCGGCVSCSNCGTSCGNCATCGTCYC
jgi:hypothetical protein